MKENKAVSKNEKFLNCESERRYENYSHKMVIARTGYPGYSCEEIEIHDMPDWMLRK